VALSISNLKFSYTGEKDILVVKDLHLPTSEIISVLGPSGCGKTTLLLLIAGLLRNSTDKIRLFGMQPSEFRKTGAMSVVFQSPTLLPWRTVMANIALPFDLRGEIVEESKINNVLELVGLNNLQDAHVDELSGGMQSRVALARALVTDPLLLLMDEPFGSLDEFNRLKLNLALAKIQKQFQMTVIFITHNINEAILISDRILVMGQKNIKNQYTEICENIKIDFPNKTLESISSSQFQATYQFILNIFHKEFKR
jgi:NitT/TauT family transport system ATP-binding protein